jgi:acrylyl-CoA reductase (NADPH)
MTKNTYRAMVVSETGEGRFVRKVSEKPKADLPDGEVLIRVAWSSLNYKDALSATGNRGVTRSYPHTPGIDAAGIVETSRSDRFNPGQEVLVTGFDLGMNTAGGFAQYVQVPAAWVVPLPAGLSLRESMILGTAGFTAALSVEKLTAHGVAPDGGPVLVTGATGGVGSIALAILAARGFEVAAVSGKKDQIPYLERLGAAEVLSRESATDASGRPLLKGRWAGVVDTVGGEILATALKATRYGGAVTCCGLVASPDLPTSVFPFILRGISLLGIDSVECPMAMRLRVWKKLAGEWKIDILDDLATVVSLDTLDPQIDLILEGKQKGRVLIDLS